jgi:hypothetical protein
MQVQEKDAKFIIHFFLLLHIYPDCQLAYILTAN